MRRGGSREGRRVNRVRIKGEYVDEKREGG